MTWILLLVRQGEAATATDTEADGGALPEGFFDAGVDPSQDVATGEDGIGHLAHPVLPTQA